MAVSWSTRVSTFPASTRLTVIVHVPVLTFPPNDAVVFAKPLTVTPVKFSPAAPVANVCPGGPALSVKSWEPLKVGPEKSGCEIAAPGGAKPLVVMTAARVSPAPMSAANAVVTATAVTLPESFMGGQYRHIRGNRNLQTVPLDRSRRAPWPGAAHFAASPR